MLFHNVHPPPSMRIQNESSSAVGVFFRNQTLYVPAAGALNASCTQPAEVVGALFRLCADGETTYCPDEAVESGTLSFQLAPTMPRSASSHTVLPPPPPPLSRPKN